MTTKLNSCSLWTHSHWAMWSYFISTEICVISTFSWSIDRDFLGIRFAKNSKKHSTNNKGKKKRKFLPFTIGFWVQLRSLTAATRERKLHDWLPDYSLLGKYFILLEAGAGLWISTSCMRSKISSVYLSPVSTCIQPNSSPSMTSPYPTNQKL